MPIVSHLHALFHTATCHVYIYGGTSTKRVKFQTPSKEFIDWDKAACATLERLKFHTMPHSTSENLSP